MNTIGLANRQGENEREARNQVFRSAKEFARRFEERCKTTLGRDLPGVDISTESGLKKSRKENRVKKTCPQYVQPAAETLLELQNPPPALCGQRPRPGARVWN